VLAHPGRLGAGERDRLAACEAGVDGVEVWRSQRDAGLAAGLLRTVRRCRC
jgi:hypothetical protein